MSQIYVPMYTTTSSAGSSVTSVDFKIATTQQITQGTKQKSLSKWNSGEIAAADDEFFIKMGGCTFNVDY